jgi:ABC-type transport system involved in Fe-S cluster assembly fused permease/ATPase subunit
MCPSVYNGLSVMYLEGAWGQDRPGAQPLQLRGGEIRFENVTFGYGPDRLILRDASFTVPAGKRVAIVGASGSGCVRLSMT